MVIIPGKNKNLTARFYAGAIDYFLFFFICGVYIYLVGDEMEQGGYKVVGFKALVFPIIWIAYFPICEATTGQTLAKRAFKLVVTDLMGRTPNFGQTFSRRILDLFEIIFFGIPGMLSINFSPRNQRIGDMLAGTRVVTTQAICRFCGVDLELTPKEVVKDVFICPNCQQVN